MKLTSREVMFKSRFLNVFLQNFVDRKGKQNSWFFASREQEPRTHYNKSPDAVVIVGIWENEEGAKRLVLTDEFRVPIDARELGFPAGLIDKGESIEEAAIREFKEETGLDFEVTQVSPPNLYSSAGMTNESVAMVFGRATGEPSTEGNESLEDIEIILATHEDLESFVDGKVDRAIGAKSWAVMWAYMQTKILVSTE